MLMRGAGKPARLHYLAGSTRVLSAGDHVVCAVSGRRIPLDELRYWSVARQEPYAGPAESIAAERLARAAI